MADTVTPLMGFVKPEVGASNNTWGNKTNGNWDKADIGFVRNTAQWKITPGDDNPISTAGPWKLNRYGNDGIKIDEPIVVNRQDGSVFLPYLTTAVHLSNGIRYAHSASGVPVPPAGNSWFYFDAQGNPVVRRPDGSICYLGVPPGTVAWCASNTPDVGWAFCDGGTVPVAQNPALYSRWGLIFGGDSTNMRLPDIRGRTIASADKGAGRLTPSMGGTVGSGGGSALQGLTVAQLAAHRHHVELSETAHSHKIPLIDTDGSQKPAGTGTSSYNKTTANGTSTEAVTTGIRIISTDAGGNETTNSTGSDQQHNNTQPTFVMQAQVKLG